VFGIVEPKGVASTASVVGGCDSTLLAGERGHRRETAVAAATRTKVATIKIHTGRLSVEKARTACAQVPFFRFMRSPALGDKYASLIDANTTKPALGPTAVKGDGRQTQTAHCVTLPYIHLSPSWQKLRWALSRQPA